MPERHLGRQIGKYRVIRLLGGGAFAWVYEAIDLDLEIPVALKILRPEFSGNETAEARFRREASTAARLRHPNIVVVRDVGQIDGASFVAMDLLASSLGQRLRSTRALPEAEVVRIGLDVAAALAFAHSAGVIHRDIKPDNILFGPGGEAVVADFGLARALSQEVGLSATNQVMGTPHYFSPEQARGLELDGRSDLYSLGVTLYRAATGKLPFDGEDWYAVGRQHIDDPVPPPRAIAPFISPALEEIILQLLAKQPSERHASGDVLAFALQSISATAAEREGMALTLAARTAGPFTPLPSTAVEVHAPSRGRAAGTVIRRSSPMRMLLSIAFVLAGGVALLRFTNPGNAWSRLVGSDASADSLAALAYGRNPDTVIARARRADSLAADSIRNTLREDSLSKPALIAAADSDVSRRGVVPLPVRGKAPGAADVAPRARITLTSDDDAVLFVDGERVGAGRWTGERPTTRDVVVRAVLDDAPVGCSTAQRDSVLRLKPGTRPTITLGLTGCAAIKLDVQPADAHLVFTPVQGGTRLTFRADSVRGKLLTYGHYKVEAAVPRCATFSDTLTAPQGVRRDTVFLRAHLMCGIPGSELR